MSNESELWRQPPARPYHPSGAKLHISRTVLELTLSAFKITCMHRLEAACFWYGLRNDARNATVHAVVMPQQQNTWGNYSISADAMAAAAAAMSSFDYVNIAQIHTHPGVSVEHSRFDDAMANSRRALSLVIPHYGQWQGQWPQGIGVHEFQDDYWHLLSAEDAAERVIVNKNAAAIKFVDLR